MDVLGWCLNQDLKWGRERGMEVGIQVETSKLHLNVWNLNTAEMSSNLIAK